MRIKPPTPIMYVTGSMLWVYGFGMSETKITDMWYVGMAVMMLFHGIEKLVEDTDAAKAHVFGRIANTSMFVTFGLIIFSFIVN